VTGWSDLPDESQNQLYDKVKNTQDQNYVPKAVDWALSDGHSLQELQSDPRLLQEYVNKEKGLEQGRKVWYEQEREKREALEHQRKLPGMINEFEKGADQTYGRPDVGYADFQRDELMKMFQRKDPRAWKVGWDKLYKEWVRAGRPKEGDEAYKKWVEAGEDQAHPDRKWVREEEEEAKKARKRVRWK